MKATMMKFIVPDGGYIKRCDYEIVLASQMMIDIGMEHYPDELIAHRLIDEIKTAAYSIDGFETMDMGLARLDSPRTRVLGPLLKLVAEMYACVAELDPDAARGFEKRVSLATGGHHV